MSQSAAIPAIPSTMRAVHVSAYGNNDALNVVTTDVPSVGEGEILVRTLAAGINPVDYKIVRGYLSAFPTQFPFVPGWDIAGEVVAVGHAARRFQVGDLVYAYLRRPSIHKGTYAQYVAAPELYFAKAPKSISANDAAGIPLAGLTAYQSLHHADKNIAIKAGEVVLVLGASGGVGGFAIQLAKAAGATVWAVCSEKNFDYCRSLGADQCFTYDEKHPSASLAHIPAGSVDFIYNCHSIATFETLQHVLNAKTGRTVAIVGSSAYAAPYEEKTGKPYRYVFVEPNAPQLEKFSALVDDGKIKTHTSKAFSIDEVRAAHENMETGHTVGKTVIDMTR